MMFARVMQVAVRIGGETPAGASDMVFVSLAPMHTVPVSQEGTACFQSLLLGEPLAPLQGAAEVWKITPSHSSE
jgi:hypothetical protein